ncbi:MAG TPA: APC family permease [Microbacteriaceae bacterium]|nr:APC family permease [Microbacteriaceae bacterium]
MVEHVTPSAAGATLKRNLGLIAVVGLGLGYMTPTVVFDTFGNIAVATGDVVPASYIAALIVLIFTALSYGKMAGAFPDAGSAYTYVQRSVHPNVGFMVGWAALLDYLLLPLVNAIIIRGYLEWMFPDVPAWIWVVTYVVATTAIIYLTMRGTSNLNMLLLVGSLIVMAVFVVVVVAQLMQGEGAGTLVSSAPFVNDQTTMAVLLTGAALVCFSFIGFDAVTMYAEEARDPKIIPRAILLTVLAGGVIFLVAAYFTQLRFPSSAGFPDDAINETSLPFIGETVGGNFMMILLTAAGFAATVASGLASQASVARMMLVMGRNNVLPRRVFGHVSPKWQTPTYSVLVAGAVSLLAIPFNLEVVYHLISFGALIAFTFVNVSVIAWFGIRKGMRSTPRDILTYWVFPIVGMALTIVLWTSLSPETLTQGAIWFGIGFVYLLFVSRGLRRRVEAFDENQPVTGFTKAVG